ncbi:MogA/MoaB family molybdenum cofactor biosynthesis protein [Rubrivirga sp.]|uniref:MogA/MoaB family molybdenum cofactor biosynthesis protein n=1 Tax=Rubrivirga sp. TaxID=1885344 RepID=UPI003C7952B7
MSVAEHRSQAADTPVACAVVTVSDTRDETTDHSGKHLTDGLRDAGHLVEFYRIVPDEPEAIRTVLLHLAGRVEVVITTGGTGVGRRDRTPEVADRLIQKPLPGFGELFRMLSFQEIGAASMLSRATAGLYGLEDGDPETLLFCCPGSVDAVTLALDRLILPDLAHVVHQVVRQPAGEPASRPEFPVA